MITRIASPDALERIGRRSWAALGVFLATMAAAWLIPHVLLLIVPITAAGLVAALLRPLVTRLESRGLPPLAATWSTLLLAAVVVAAVVLLLVPTVSTEFGALRTQLGTGVSNIEGWLVDGHSAFPRQRWIDGPSTSRDRSPHPARCCRRER